MRPAKAPYDEAGHDWRVLVVAPVYLLALPVLYVAAAIVGGIRGFVDAFRRPW